MGHVHGYPFLKNKIYSLAHTNFVGHAPIDKSIALLYFKMPLQMAQSRAASQLRGTGVPRQSPSSIGIRRRHCANGSNHYKLLGIRKPAISPPSDLQVCQTSFLESLSTILRPKPAKEAPKKTGTKTVFVAGSTGRVGARIVRELLALGYSVRAGCRNVESAQENIDVAEACECVWGESKVWSQ